MSNWTSLIPANIRTTLYIGFGVLSLAQTGILAYTSAVGTPAPLWAIGGGAVLGVIGGAFGFVAAGNTNVGGLNVGTVELTHHVEIADGQARVVATDTPDGTIYPDDLDSVVKGN